MYKNNNIIKTAFLAVILSIGAFTGCKKDTETNGADKTTAVSLSAATTVSETLYDDVYDVVMTEGESANILGLEPVTVPGASCAMVTLSTIDANTFPKTMTIDFGTGCTSSNGITRKGKIIATLSGKLRNSGSTISVSFENYFVNNFQVEGIFSFTNNSATEGLVCTTSVTGGKITYPDITTFYTYSGTHTLTQTAGAATATLADNVYSITGNSSTASSENKTLVVNITTPLIKDAACKNIIAGTESFTYNNISGIIDFGDGSCDNTAVVKILGQSQIITLPR